MTFSVNQDETIKLGRFVLQEVRGQGKHAALHFQRGHIFRFKFFGGVIVRLPWIDLGSTGEHIDRSEIIFGPGVNRQMRLRDHHDAGNAVRIEGVEDNVDNSGFRVLGRFDHDGFHFMHIVEDFRIAVVEFNEEMSSE